MGSVIGPKTRVHRVQQPRIGPHHTPRDQVHQQGEQRRQRHARQDHQPLQAQHRAQRGVQVLRDDHLPAQRRHRFARTQFTQRHQHPRGGGAEAHVPGAAAWRTCGVGLQRHRIEFGLVVDQRASVVREHRHREHGRVVGVRQHFVTQAAEPVRVQFGQQQGARAPRRIKQGHADIDAELWPRSGLAWQFARVGQPRPVDGERGQRPVGDRCGQVRGIGGHHHVAVQAGHRDGAVDRVRVGQSVQLGARRIGFVEIDQVDRARQQVQLGGAAFERPQE